MSSLLKLAQLPGNLPAAAGVSSPIYMMIFGISLILK
jgi:hypothetical protein